MNDQLRLHSYWRSSASYRVRIGLNLKGLEYETVPVHLVRNGGEQHDPVYRALNPQGLVPVLQHGSRTLTQSIAILEYLDEVWPRPNLLPTTARDRHRVRAIAQTIACEIHPLNNLRVLQYLDGTWNVPQPEREGWIKHWIVEGFTAVEAMLREHPATGVFCEGDTPGLADCCLVPQLYNARRFGAPLEAFPTLLRIERACLELAEFDRARPENQPDCPPA
ncbi:maleylacetoacetate isomerase [Lysobacter enzymogenes]|uniref:Maleylacetoacetate isomerase n=1 Tax=Lysobacter enzymogenes TaxID=69 RepID=A0A3N2RJH4_LYSEN|nr:maleylacetoacetate isomerase [Lysobacter enzymogenes]ROU07628.1 maleylacetoacetate isomerase [Lysobacter enzymogenes]